MSLTLCGLTNESIKDPVVSLLSGHIFEKSAIKKHLSSFPYCPITNQPMGLNDLIDVHINQELCEPTENSVKTYLSRLQDQYDIIVLESFQLRKNLKQLKSELIECVYANEGAYRVIQKLLQQIKEDENQIQRLQRREQN